jgi:uncharacterized lipoprotein YddW (UPF0748 family)
VRAALCLWIALAACSGPPAELEPDSAVPETDAAIEPDAAPDAAPVAPAELRGVWITRFSYTTKAQLEAIIDRAAGAGFNAVFVQIRGEGDAYYQSTREPWARRLTGTLGRNPGWDPLQTAIDRAHGHGMQLHAYFNALSAWSAATAVPVAEGTVQHALRTNPSWLAVIANGTNTDTEYKWFSPGIPAVRAHIVATATDLLSNYAVDGLHLDRIRMPGVAYSKDAVTVAAYNTAKASNPTLTWADFMRSQIDLLVAQLHTAIVATRPSVVFSAAVWGIYDRLPGCTTSQGFADYFQDSLHWLDAGTMDALVPMIYWSIEPGACTDWTALLDSFTTRNAGRHIWAGMHALDDDAWDFSQVEARVRRSRDVAQGLVVYASNYLDPDPARWSAFKGSATEPGLFADPAPVPTMSWK